MTYSTNFTRIALGSSPALRHKRLTSLDMAWPVKPENKRNSIETRSSNRVVPFSATEASKLRCCREIMAVCSATYLNVSGAATRIRVPIKVQKFRRNDWNNYQFLVSWEHPHFVTVMKVTLIVIATVRLWVLT